MKTTIHTLKKEYKDNQTYLNEKQKLFQNLTYHMIEKEFHHNDIDIKYEEVLNRYNIKIDVLDNDFIGGCKLKNDKLGVIIDNTLKTNLDEI